MSKALILMVLLVAVSASGALAQAGYIGLYADEAGTACSVADQGGSQLNVYVIHQAVSGAAVSQWRIATGAGFAMTYLGESWSVVAIGDTQSGASASYGACLGSPILLATVTYVSHGTSTSCSYLEVVADPASSSGTIEVVDCSSQRLTGVGSRLLVNPDGTCPCGQANPAQETDWGRIKAMYSN